MNQLTREKLTQALIKGLEPLDDVLAFWEAGSAAFGRLDHYSDLDVQMIVADDAVETAFEQVEAILLSLSPISDRFRIPEPTWHGHSQAFYTLEDAPEFLLVDLAVMKEHTDADRFLQSEVHGEQVVYFDKKGLITAVPFDHAAHQQQLQKRLSEIEQRFHRTQLYVKKELLRGHTLSALHFYRPLTVQPLIELLGMKHDPTRYNWGLRYMHFYLPEAERKQLEAINLITDLDDLAGKFELAQAWIKQLLEELRE